MHTDRFRQLRKKELSGILEKNAVSKIWRKIVRDQLRATEIKDLFDHYDFNYNIEDRAVALKSDILDGTYTVSAPLIYRVEKKFGVCRHMVIPQPIDALLLQLLVESVAEKIVAKQPSGNAFYSRDKHNVKKPHEDIEYGLSFRKQWKKLQKKIYKFNEEKELIIVTDLSNYYDSIHLEELRKVFVSLVEANEVIVDLLFKVIECISWVPDYLPYSKRGLPTSNIEAIRLLAHSFLFEIDAVLKEKTHNSFARWMDDITIGVNSKKEAISLLSSMSDMLKSRGLALNLSKTAIYDSKAARHNFQIDQNIYLDSLEKIELGTEEALKARKELRGKFNLHLKGQCPKYWGKVAKRFITAFGRLSSTSLVGILPRIYIDYPGLRPNLLIYLDTIGYSARTAYAVSRILQDLDVFDDLSLFQVCNLLTSWEIPRSKSAIKNISAFESAVTKLCFESKEPSGFYSLLWFKSKYSSPKELMAFLRKYQNLWQSNSFLRRQATICISRLFTPKSSDAQKMLASQALSGVQGTVSVANQISQFSQLTTLESKVRLYLFPTYKPRVYPLGKFMVLCSILNSETLRNNKKLREDVLTNLSDPTYRKWIRVQYGIADDA